LVPCGGENGGRAEAKKMETAVEAHDERIHGRRRSGMK